MEAIKFSFYFDQGTIELETKDEAQINSVLAQLTKNVPIVHIPSESKDWYIEMQKVKAYCIDKEPFKNVVVDVQETPPAPAVESNTK